MTRTTQLVRAAAGVPANVAPKGAITKRSAAWCRLGQDLAVRVRGALLGWPANLEEPLRVCSASRSGTGGCRRRAGHDRQRGSKFRRTTRPDTSSRSGRRGTTRP